MKRISITVAMTVFLLVPLVWGATSFSYAQQSQSVTQKALSPEDMQKLRNDLACLSQVMGLEITGKDDGATKK